MNSGHFEKTYLEYLRQDQKFVINLENKVSLKFKKMEQCETPHGNLNIFYQILIFIRHTLVPAVDIKSKVEHFFSASKPWRK